MSLVGFGVRNLRCLTDTGIVPIKPITLLVGRNSSGKSTFLRAFPLLRQSVENARRSPVLWFHKDGVDFGNIETAINERASERSVTFEFAVQTQDGRRELNMTVAPAPDSPYVKSYVLRGGKERVRLEFDPAHRLVGIDGQSYDRESIWLSGRGHLIAPLGRKEGAPVYQAHTGSTLGAKIDGVLGGLTKLDDIFIKLASSLTVDSLLSPDVTSLLRVFDDCVATFMFGVAYLGPHRAIAQRFHRQTEVAVEMVDPGGENLADFLASLSPGEWESFQAFTKKYHGFEPYLRREGMNIEILIKEPGGEHFKNIVDVGFGYAEVLPLCATLWSSCVRAPSPARRQISLVALEQPELHLHPAFQAELADSILGSLQESRKAGREVKLMIETHSEGIVNNLGNLIENKALSSDDVQIVFFNQDPETRETRLHFAGYDDDGALHNWPFGFFASVKENPFAVAVNE